MRFLLECLARPLIVLVLVICVVMRVEAQSPRLTSEQFEVAVTSAVSVGWTPLNSTQVRFAIAARIGKGWLGFGISPSLGIGSSLMINAGAVIFSPPQTLSLGMCISCCLHLVYAYIYPRVHHFYLNQSCCLLLLYELLLLFKTSYYIT